MSRTPLFRAVKKAFARASRKDAIVWPRSSALTRRKLLRLSAAAAGATALAPVINWRVFAEEKGKPPSIAIIGGGAAGLTAAYRLQAADVNPIVFEASNRWGGRMFTQYDFYKGMFCELGGELVDSNHEDLHNLANELGVGMQKLTDDGGEDLYFFKGVFHTPKDMLDPGTETGAFVPIAKQVAEDAGKLLDEEENWTEFAHELDRVSLKDYLEQFRGKAEDWAIDLLDVAYNIEFGLLTEEQSSLLMVDFIGTDLNKPFEIFGESDEAWRVKGGSSALINALVAALKDKAEMQLGHALTEIGTKDQQIVLNLSAPGGSTRTESYDAVILTLPFTKLREVKGLESLDLGEEKLKCIREYGFGKNGKVMNGTTSRVWRSPDSDLPAPSNGSFYSDSGFQDLYETSRAQPGEAGIITNYIGIKAGITDAKSALEAFRAGLEKMSPKMAESLDPNAVTSFFWGPYPYTLGSYSATKPGQYTTFPEVAGEPALDGRLQFAGEHTSVDWFGYMNAAVESGNRVSDALAEAFALNK